MVELDVAFFAFSVAFGALMGFGLGRQAEDRLPSLSACAATAATGVVAWYVGAPGTEPEVAGAAMTVGGMTALAVVALGGRRPVDAG